MLKYYLGSQHKCKVDLPVGDIYQISGTNERDDNRSRSKMITYEGIKGKLVIFYS